MKPICRMWVEERQIPSACLRQGRKAEPGPRRAGKGGELVCVHPTEGRSLRDSTDKGGEKPISTHAAAELRETPRAPSNTEGQAQKAWSMLGACKGIYSGYNHRFPRAPRQSIQRLPSEPPGEDAGANSSSREVPPGGQ